MSMKLSIRMKLLILLATVALLPLLAALIAISVGSRQLRTEAYGTTISSMASAKATALQIILQKDVEKICLIIQREPGVVEALKKPQKEINPAETSRLDNRWASLPETSEPLRSILTNPVSKRFRQLAEGDPTVSEILLTDRYGQLLAATRRTEDFYQRDEDWWRDTWNNATGKIVLTPVHFDKSANVWCIDICVPVRDGQQVIGVAKAVIDLSRWLAPIREAAQQGDSTIAASRMLLRKSDGKIIFRDDVNEPDKKDLSPLTESVGHWSGLIAHGKRPGWRVSDDGVLQGYAPIFLPKTIADLPVKAPGWVLAVYIPEAEALGGIRTLSLLTLAGGLLVIGGIFLLGLGMAERSIVSRIRRLTHAARRVSEGDLSHRIRSHTIGTHMTGADEIDELAQDFNRMVNRVQKSHQMLVMGNELKTNFIRVAGHELRTPLSYILGMGSLLKNCKDPERLSQAVQSMTEKGKRLEAIIRSMFKLMSEHGQVKGLQLEEVSVSELLEEVYLDCSPFLEQRHQRLIVEPCKDIPPMQVDRGKIQDCLSNLVMNAIKFTPDGGVVKLRAGQQLGDYIAIAIQDQGPGISEGDLPHIFDPFYSTSDVFKHSSGDIGYQKRGMGLGLAIVRHFVELHGGTIHVSTCRTGSVFTVTIPRVPKTGKQAEPSGDQQ